MAASEVVSARLPGELVSALRESVAAGEYPSVDDALAEAVEKWSSRHEERAEDVAWMRAKIRASLLDPRPSLSMDEVKLRMEAFFEADERRDNAAA